MVVLEAQTRPAARPTGGRQRKLLTSRNGSRRCGGMVVSSVAPAAQGKRRCSPSTTTWPAPAGRTRRPLFVLRNAFICAHRVIALNLKGDPVADGGQPLRGPGLIDARTGQPLPGPVRDGPGSSSRPSATPWASRRWSPRTSETVEICPRPAPTGGGPAPPPPLMIDVVSGLLDTAPSRDMMGMARQVGRGPQPASAPAGAEALAPWVCGTRRRGGPGLVLPPPGPTRKAAAAGNEAIFD